MDMTAHEFVRVTKEHMNTVMWYILQFSLKLGQRAVEHDASKIKDPEADIFREMTPKLKGLTYGSKEYGKCLDKMRVALDHHYLVNRHHPEHFENGLRGMTLIDLVEMFCDWQAATQRHADGDIVKSIEKNQDRFGYSDDLKDIFLNTAAALSDTERGKTE